jgi:hypothetical protein
MVTTKTDDVLFDVVYDINEPDCEPDNVIAYDTFAELYDDLIDTAKETCKPIIVRTDLMRSVKNHDWFKQEFEKEKVKAVYILDPIADFNYLKYILDDSELSNDYEIVLRHRKELFDKEYGVEMPYLEIDIIKKVVI